jgi:hypothetical protein
MDATLIPSASPKYTERIADIARVNRDDNTSTGTSPLTWVDLSNFRAAFDRACQSVTQGPRTTEFLCASLNARWSADAPQGNYVMLRGAPTVLSSWLLWPAVRQERPQANLAKELRVLSGLKVDPICQLLEVTRQTFYNWTNGLAMARDSEHRLLRTLAIVRQAMRSFGSPAAVRHWLETPVGRTQVTPFELIRTGDYETASGLALMRSTALESDPGRFARPRPLAGVALSGVRRSAQQKRRQALRRIDRDES